MPRIRSSSRTVERTNSSGSSPVTSGISNSSSSTSSATGTTRPPRTLRTSTTQRSAEIALLVEHRKAVAEARKRQPKLKKSKDGSNRGRPRKAMLTENLTLVPVVKEVPISRRKTLLQSSAVVKAASTKVSKDAVKAARQTKKESTKPGATAKRNVQKSKVSATATKEKATEPQSKKTESPASKARKKEFKAAHEKKAIKAKIAELAAKVKKAKAARAAKAAEAAEAANAAKGSKPLTATPKLTRGTSSRATTNTRATKSTTDNKKEPKSKVKSGVKPAVVEKPARRSYVRKQQAFKDSESHGSTSLQDSLQSSVGSSSTSSLKPKRSKRGAPIDRSTAAVGVGDELLVQDLEVKVGEALARGKRSRKPKIMSDEIGPSTLQSKTDISLASTSAILANAAYLRNEGSTENDDDEGDFAGMKLTIERCNSSAQYPKNAKRLYDALVGKYSALVWDEIVTPNSKAFEVQLSVNGAKGKIIWSGKDRRAAKQTAFPETTVFLSLVAQEL